MEANKFAAETRAVLPCQLWVIPCLIASLAQVAAGGGDKWVCGRGEASCERSRLVGRLPVDDLGAGDDGLGGAGLDGLLESSAHFFVERFFGSSSALSGPAGICMEIGGSIAHGERALPAIRARCFASGPTDRKGEPLIVSGALKDEGQAFDVLGE